MISICLLIIYFLNYNQSIKSQSRFDHSEVEPLSSSLSPKDNKILESCFPSNNRFIDIVPDPLASPPRGWWCDSSQEYGWLGYSYDVGDCPTETELIKTFSWMRNVKGARYVRIYSACDQPRFNDHLINAASRANLGIYSLIWFGFDGDDKWKTRRKALISSIKQNSKAPYVIRAVTVGSEPLFDEVLELDSIVKLINDLKVQLKPYKIPVTLADMAYGFQMNGDAPEVFRAIDFVSLNVLPIFDTNATKSDKSLKFIKFNISYAKLHGNGKRVVIVQTGWPSNKILADRPLATTDLVQEQRYFELLNDNCRFFKAQGVGWFAHIFDDDTFPGWGLNYGNGTEKIEFNPIVEC
ncbi:glycoside hydrolase superfamily [Phakopsora pachyrhizi]|uniref:glucan endo-1,3-beta-D-glucosidase n=1 Tax=Phakopsora pachyrhizi TaxID=170000 RepID=A0AAV0AS11_PHAPC|nr:glycoside hydrolase superfamily [Phakopsora pachyrhizi]CAH7672209.1 glycoside hydrolase superfamily [Phakopsora pachyrhizi]